MTLNEIFTFALIVVPFVLSFLVICYWIPRWIVRARYQKYSDEIDESIRREGNSEEMVPIFKSSLYERDVGSLCWKFYILWFFLIAVTLYLFNY